MLYPDDYVGKVICGDCRQVLAGMPDASVNCVITSPPYWALRDYKTEAQIWGGEAGCQHEWVAQITKQDNLRFRAGEDSTVGNNINPEIYSCNRYANAFCSLCGAWRGSLGLEPTFELYIKHLCDIFDEVKRVLRDDGTLWVNLGDTYHNATKWTNKDESPHTISHGNNRDFRTGRLENQSIPEKCLCLIPERFAIEMVSRGWILRNKIIWFKRNCMPSSAKDRFTVDFEDIFFFTKSRKYWFEQQFEPYIPDSIRPTKINKNNPKGMNRQGMDEWLKNAGQGRNMRCVWDVTTRAFKEAHFATFPEALVEPIVKAGCPPGGVALDPFAGSGTVCLVAVKLGRKYIGIDLNSDYVKICEERLRQEYLF